jgi:hypothetical protein
MMSMMELSAELRLADDEVMALGEAIAETAAILDAVTHRFLAQLRAFDRAGGWERTGALSCAHWLSWRVGMDLGAARERVRVARKLADLPVIDGALAEGSVSYSKVRAMTRVATAVNEGDFLTMARTTTGAQLERICRLARQVESLAGKDPRDVEDRQRYAISRRTEDGMASIQIRLHSEEAARVMKALELASDGGNLADGAVALAEAALAAGRIPEPVKGRRRAGATVHPEEPPRSSAQGRTNGPPRAEGDATAGSEGADVAPLRSPVEVVIHISADTLTGETELGDGVSAETARRLLCDAGVVPLLEDGHGKTVDVGRKSRTIHAALHRALRWRDRGCRFPGCANARFVDAHHLRHWVDGGETSLDNTFLVCRRHHRFLHEYGYSVEQSGDQLVFRDASGCLIPPQGERPTRLVGPDEWLRLSVSDSGATISADSNTPGWDGQRIDHDLCVAAIFADRAGAARDDTSDSGDAG